MFRIAFFVDDKALAEVMHAISGRARNLEVAPVPNAAPGKNGQVKQVAGSTIELLEKALRKRAVAGRFGGRELGAAIKEIGFSPNSRGHYAQMLLKGGVMTRTGKGNAVVYTLVK